ncbi:hypothetical protein A2U01_0099598, partial [Trifolium medium]|nr:hypothetical protein [Trifolium medium]
TKINSPPPSRTKKMRLPSETLCQEKTPPWKSWLRVCKFRFRPDMILDFSSPLSS